MSGMWRKAALAAAAGFLLSAVGASAMNLAWVHANAAAQSEQRVKAGFDAWLKETGKDWNVSLLDSGGSGERTASNLQDAASRGVDAIIITMADLRASRAALDAAIKANIPVITVDSGYIPGVLVDITTNNWAMSSDVSPYLLNELGGKGNIATLRHAAAVGAYTLIDSATLVMACPEGYAGLFRGDPVLVNQFCLIPVSPELFPAVNGEGARQVMSAPGRIETMALRSPASSLRAMPG